MDYRETSRLDDDRSPIHGISPWVKDIREDIRTLAGFSANVLIVGPSGTGKELIARAIHAQSSRAKNPFVPVDCAAVCGTLFVSHIFGHIAGAFTGANHAELGCFRAAHSGTILLDEIGELDFDLQSKLLRVLQERTVIPLGSHREMPVDVRVIAATNRDLKHDVAAGRFRRDLYYRLNVISIETVPLRRRPEDIEVLASHFLAKLAVDHGLPLKRLSVAAIEQMHGYAWPGNVRELENVLERAVLFSRGDVIGPDSIAGLLDPAPSAASTAPPDPEHWPTLAETERELIQRTLEQTNYNQSAAARLLDVERHWLLRRIRKHGLDLSRSRRGRPRKRRLARGRSG